MNYLSPNERKAIESFHPDTLSGVLLDHGWTYEQTRAGFQVFSKGAIRVKFPNTKSRDPETETAVLTRLLFQFAATEELSTYEAVAMLLFGLRVIERQL